VNGLVRGIVVPAAGRQEVTMSYRPAAFVNGVRIAVVTLALLLALIGWGRLVLWKGPLRRVSRPEPALATRSSVMTRPASAHGGQAVGP
jgi:hypothetical protein